MEAILRVNGALFDFVCDEFLLVVYRTMIARIGLFCELVFVCFAWFVVIARLGLSGCCIGGVVFIDFACWVWFGLLPVWVELLCWLLWCLVLCLWFACIALVFCFNCLGLGLFGHW